MPRLTKLDVLVYGTIIVTLALSFMGGLIKFK